jgi:hypothetical protein
MNNTASSAIYSERVVAFIDILGFSAIVANSITSPEQASSLVKILQQMADGARSDLNFAAGEDFKVQTFSDCIVMSENASDYGLSHLVYAVSGLARDLLAEGVLARGGIAKGRLYHSDGIVFGPALIVAYGLESTTAKYPRIVVDRGAHQHFKQIQANRDLVNEQNQLRYDDDGPVFVDFLAPFRDDMSHASVLDAKNASRCRAAIQNQLNEAIYDPNIYLKLRWLSIYWNSVRTHQPLIDMLEPVEFPITENLKR